MQDPNALRKDLQGSFAESETLRRAQRRLSQEHATTAALAIASTKQLIEQSRQLLARLDRLLANQVSTSCTCGCHQSWIDQLNEPCDDAAPLT
jgi:hypothetical protein